MAPVADGRGASPVAPRDLLDPAHRIPRDPAHFGSGHPAREQPQHLPLTARHRVPRLPIALLQFRDRHVRGDRHPSCHPGSLYPESVLGSEGPAKGHPRDAIERSLAEDLYVSWSAHSRIIELMLD